MTRHPYAAHRRDDHPLDPPLHATVATVGDLLAAVPALLGFVPEHSIVLICLSRGSTTTVRMTVRQDLPDPPATKEVFHAIERCAQVCDREAYDAIVAVLVVGDRAPAQFDSLADDLHEVFDALDIEVLGVHVVPTITADAPWSSLGGDDRHGSLPDPRTSAVAASTVVSGRPIRSSRSDLLTVLAPASVDDCARFERHCAEVAETLEPLTPGELLAEVVDDVELLDLSGELDSVSAARAMAGLAVLSIRDALLGLAGTRLDATAGALWVELTRRTSGPQRAAPATMVAVWFYLRGDGPMAGTALEVALAADPGYRLAVLLDAALQNGLGPAVVTDLVESARGVAASLGIALPTDE